MEFSSYMGPMDRDYGKSSVGDNSTNDVNIGIKEIGQSVPMGIAAQNVQGIAAKIRAGAGSLELGFAGVGRGQRNAHTPGQYGKDQRQAIKELAMVNEIDLTTHAAYGIMGLAGMDQRGNFSKDHRKFAVDEIKRAIDFAADTALGGSVVVHTGEFQRPISEADWNTDRKFMQHSEEHKTATVRLVDSRTGEVKSEIRKNQTVARPVWNKFEPDNKVFWDSHGGNSYVDSNNNVVNPGDYIDYEGNKIVDPFDPHNGRVPCYDASTNRFKVYSSKWEDFEREADERNLVEAKRMGMSLEEYKSKYPSDYLYPEEAFLRASMESNEGHSRGWALNYSKDFQKYKDSLVKLRKAKSFYEQVWNNTPEDERWTLKQQARDFAASMSGGMIPPEFNSPVEILDHAINDAVRTLEQIQQSAVAQEQQALEVSQTRKHILSAEKYALKESHRSYAEAALHAFDLTKQRNLERPLMITMENIYPESYGAHPDELKSLIINSRKKMVDMLTKPEIDGDPNPNFRPDISRQEAEKAASTHIKATLDIGHMNMWRKYWQNDPKKSISENDGEFKKWFIKKTEELAPYVGNVHLTDNFGYQDDHLSPGEGNSPVKEVVNALRKGGYKGVLTTEPGADATNDLGDFWGVMKAWRLFGSPVYGAHGPSRADAPRGSWSDIQYSYFGQVQPPYYIFGSYSPSQDWTLWSQVPLE